MSDDNVPATTTGSSFAVLRTVQWCQQQNLVPVPVRFRDKAALDEKYKHAGYKPPYELWKRENLNIGLVTGPTGNDSYDADLDCSEAIALATHFLPRTDAVYGRASKPNSHYLYLCPGADFRYMQFKDPVTQQSIIELRGGPDFQSVLPGSTHSSGEVVEWSKAQYPDLPSVDMGDLVLAVKKIALGVIVLRYCWDDGFHNEPTKLLSGMFAQYGWSLGEIEAFFEAIFDVGGGDDPSRRQTMRLSVQRIEADKPTAGAGKLRKALGENGKQVVDEMLALLGSASIAAINEYNERFACVMMGGKFRIARPDDDGFIEWMDRDNFLARYAIEKSEEKNDKGKSIPKPILWLNSPSRRQYDRVEFMPGIEDHPSKFNLWTGWQVEPVDKPEACEGWLRLLRDVICGGDEGLDHWMRCWFAHILRDPMSKPRTCPSIVGREGAGKTFLVSYFAKCIRPYFVSATQERHITGNFNEHLASCLLLQSEEAIFHGDHKGAAIMRSLITDEKQVLEKKGVDARMVDQYIRLILTSNKFKSEHAQVGDRRFTKINLKDRKLSDELAEQLNEEINGDGPAALFHYLMTMPDYDPRVPVKNYKTEDHARLVLDNLDPVPLWWYSVLQSGQLLPDYAIDHMVPDQDDDTWGAVVSSPTLYTSCLEWLRENGRGRFIMSLTSTGWAMDLMKMTGKKSFTKGQKAFKPIMSDDAPKSFKTLGTRQNTIRDLPSLQECRAAFEAYIGATAGLDWGSPIDPNDKQSKLVMQMKKDAKETSAHFNKTQEK